MSFMQPRIPQTITKQFALTELRAGPPEYRPDKGGQYLPGEVTRVPFEGTLTPLSEDDLRRAPQGTYTAMNRVVRTNGHVLKMGAQIVDDCNGHTYTIVGELNYGGLATVLRYLVERKGEASP